MSELLSVISQTASTPDHEIRNDNFIPGTLSVGLDKNKKDVYNFNFRAAYIGQFRDQLGLVDGEPTPGGPWTMEIMPTPACSISCEFCSYIVANLEQSQFFRDAKRRNVATHIGLTKETVFNLLDTLSQGGNTKGTYWSGGGEPLVWPYITEALIRSAEFSKVFLQTNGTELHKLVKNPDALASVHLMSISTFAHNSDLFRTIAKRDLFDRVTDNISQVIRERDKNGLDMTVNAKVLVTPRNYLYVPDIVRFYRDTLGVDSIALRETQDYNYGSDEERAETAVLSMLQRSELLSILGENPHDPDLMAFAHAVAHQGDYYSFNPTSDCFNASHSHFAALDPLGDVYLGNPEIGDPTYSIGNLNHASWSDVWASEIHEEVISKMSFLQCYGYCDHVNCRHVKANRGSQAKIDGEIRFISDPTEIMKNFGAFM